MFLYFKYKKISNETYKYISTSYYFLISCTYYVMIHLSIVSFSLD